MTRRARDVLLDILRDEGVTHVFGNPGSTEMPLMDALVDAPDIRYILGLQEATAVGMADGWALASGRAAFVNLHAMGGLGNAMGVLVASKASETPLVVTAGQQDTRHLMTEPWLSGDLVALAEPVTKWAKELRRGEDVGQALAPRVRGLPHAAERAGLPVAADGHPRPGGEPSDAAGVFAAASRSLARRGAPRGDARRPRSGPGRRSARRRSAAGGRAPDWSPSPRPAAIPVWGTQLTSRTAFPSAHPCWAGVLKPDFADMRAHFKTSQAIVLVGGRAFVAYPYRDAEPVPEGVAVLHIADNPEAFGREQPAHMALLGDIGLTLAAAAGSPQDSSSTRTRSRRGSPRARRIRARPGRRRALDILAESANPPLTARRGGAGGARRAAARRADRQRFRGDLRPRPGSADDPARPVLLRPRRRARLQHAGGGRRGARDPRLGRLVRRRRRGDVFAAGAVERRALPRAGHLPRVQQSPLRRVAERRAGSSATPTPSPAGSWAWRSPIRRSTFRRSRPRWACRRRAPTIVTRSAPRFTGRLGAQGPSLIEIPIR